MGFSRIKPYCRKLKNFFDQNIIATLAVLNLTALSTYLSAVTRIYQFFSSARFFSLESFSDRYSKNFRFQIPRLVEKHTMVSKLKLINGKHLVSSADFTFGLIWCVKLSEIKPNR